VNIEEARQKFQELKADYNSLDVSIRMVETDAIRTLGLIQRFTGSSTLNGAIEVFQRTLIMIRSWTIAASTLMALSEAATLNPLALLHAGIAITAAATATYTLTYDVTRGMPQV